MNSTTPDLLSSTSFLRLVFWPSLVSTSPPKLSRSMTSPTATFLPSSFFSALATSSSALAGAARATASSTLSATLAAAFLGLPAGGLALDAAFFLGAGAGAGGGAGALRLRSSTGMMMMMMRQRCWRVCGVANFTQHGAGAGGMGMGRSHEDAHGRQRARDEDRRGQR